MTKKKWELELRRKGEGRRERGRPEGPSFDVLLGPKTPILSEAIILLLCISISSNRPKICTPDTLTFMITT